MNNTDEYDWELASAEPHPAAERFMAFQTVYGEETLRGKMLVTMGYVEDLLARSIAARLVNTRSKRLEEFGKRSLGSLSAKSNMAYLLGIIDDREHAIIEKMSKLRNDFAHQPMVRESDPDIRNHARDLARLLSIDQYRESESDFYVEEVWGMTLWGLLTYLNNRPERAAERRLTFNEWDISAPNQSGS